MRISPISCLLVLAGVLLSQCTTTKVPATTSATTLPAPAVSAALAGATTSVTGQVESHGPDPDKPYQETTTQSGGADQATYSASVLCKPDSLGTMLLELELNPSSYSIMKLSLAYAMASPKQTAKQVGQGTGHYDPKDQRYYFTTYYQVITQLPSNQTFYSGLHPVYGWISTRTNTIGLQR